MAFPVDEKYLEVVEEEPDAQFPPSFRSKMISENGSEVTVHGDNFDLYPFYDTTDRKRLKRTCNSIVHETKKE